MNPRRLIPYVVVFLVLAAGYLGLQWHQEKRQAQEEEAKKLFQFKTEEIEAITLVRGQQETSLVRKDKDWQITKPLATKADQAMVASLANSLASLKKEKSLGPAKDLKAFGLQPPALVVKFQVQGKTHQVAIGAKNPAGGTYYALKDEDPDVLLIPAGAKDLLDRPLAALRDKTMLAFALDKVKALKIRSDKTVVQLEKTGPATWRWVGKEGFKVRSDRVEELLRQLDAARVKEFLETPPKDLKAAGLAPQPQTEITVVTDQGQDTLWLGAKKDSGVYARKGVSGPVVLADANLPAEIAKTLGGLEEKRLFTGSVTEVAKVVWGPPSKTWTAVKEKDAWKITGPEQAEVRQPAARLDLALWNLQKLEYASVLPPGGPAPAPDAYRVELRDGSDKPLFYLAEIGKKGNTEDGVLSRMGDKEMRTLISLPKFMEWQEEMKRLTLPPPK